MMNNIKELYTTYNELESTTVHIQFETVISIDQKQQYKQLHQLIFPQLKIGIEIRIRMLKEVLKYITHSLRFSESFAR